MLRVPPMESESIVGVTTTGDIIDTFTVYSFGLLFTHIASMSKGF